MPWGQGGNTKLSHAKTCLRQKCLHTLQCLLHFIFNAGSEPITTAHNSLLPSQGMPVSWANLNPSSLAVLCSAIMITPSMAEEEPVTHETGKLQVPLYTESAPINYAVNTQRKSPKGPRPIKAPMASCPARNWQTEPATRRFLEQIRSRGCRV